MVVIRLSRGGSKKRPFYHVTVADRREARDGSFIDRLGFFNPVARGQEERLRIDVEKVDVTADYIARMKKIGFSSESQSAEKSNETFER